MAHHRALIGALGAAALWAAPGTALAGCEETILLEYDIEGGRFQVEVNGVFREAGGGQFSSGGIPITDWLLLGRNEVEVFTDAALAEFQLYAICDDNSARRDFDAANLEGRGNAVLAFDVEAPDPRPYIGAQPTDDAGLLKAVAELNQAFLARDFDAVWAMHAAMQADEALRGGSGKASAWQMEKVVENIQPTLAPGLTTNPVLGGRVWEVYGEGFAPPISADVSMNGGTVAFKTGSFWMKGPEGWSVLVKYRAAPAKEPCCAAPITGLTSSSAPLAGWVSSAHL